MTTEQLILKALLKNDDYRKTVFPHLKQDYFHSEDEKVLFSLIRDFTLKYNKPPTIDTLFVELDNKAGLTDDVVKSINTKLKDISKTTEENDLEWLKNTTEEFCRDKAIENALMESIAIVQGGKSKISKGAIPGLLSDAIGISFDTNVGHDFFSQSDKRYDYYHAKQERIPFDLKYLNLITRNGLPKKTLTVFMAGPNVGKSLNLTHIAAYFTSIGKKVLYITMEMREEEIAKRIDVNQMNISFDDLEKLSKDMFDKKVENLRKKTSGELVIKEYPNGQASTTHFKALLNELSMKRGFIPDAIIVDYMNICASARMNLSNTPKHYYVQSISEELRALATEFDLPVLTATQVNREGFRSSDVGLENISESFGVTGTADLILYIQTSEELEKLGQLLYTQLKNRLNAKSINRRFIIGVDYNKMKLFDAEDSAQEGITDSGQNEIPVFDKSSFADRTEKFKGLKV